MTGDGPMEVLIAASEALPYSKTGGLADVVGSLSQALAGNGCKVHLFQPLYRTVQERFSELEKFPEEIEMEMGGRNFRASLFAHEPSPGVTAWFIRNDSFFDREGLYGTGDGDFDDNDLRFAFFCRAVAAAAARLGIRPHVVHCHDWQGALLPLLIRHLPSSAPSLQGVPSLLTIHNLAYQGIFSRDSLARTGVPESLFHIDGVEFHGSINFLKGGILSADAVSTVSPRYSREILTPRFGSGLHGVLAARAGDLHGIINGIDTDAWDPSTDPLLPARYTSRDLSGKLLCKSDVLRSFGLPQDLEAPLMATISRLVDQKGFDIIAPALPELLSMGFRYVLLGAGSGAYEKLFRAMAEENQGGGMAVKIAYDEGLAHRIEAGADFYLMPSRFEPCGLNQMYSLRYGTIPIVRSVGGLDDTVTPYRAGSGEGNGFKFSEYTAEALVGKAREALDTYRDKEGMTRLVRNAMAEDFSWKRSAALYLELYRSLVSTRGGAG